MSASLFDGTFYQRVAALRPLIRKKSVLNYQGRRKSSHKGSSAEFSDFREYLPGDDVRRIDWNVYARLDKPFIREYMEERESAVNLFLDMSGSMGYYGKDRLAKQLTGVFACSTLAGLDRLTLHIVGSGQVDAFRFSGGKSHVQRALDAVEKAQPAGRVDLYEAVRSTPYLPSGMTVLISDFMEERFLEKGSELLRYLKYRRQEPVLLQVLAKEEEKIEEFGTYNLEDGEGVYDTVRLTLDEKTVSGYQKELESFLKELEKMADAAQASYYKCTTEKTYDRLLLGELRPLFAS